MRYYGVIRAIAGDYNRGLLYLLITRGSMKRKDDGERIQRGNEREYDGAEGYSLLAFVSVC